MSKNEIDDVQIRTITSWLIEKFKSGFQESKPAFSDGALLTDLLNGKLELTTAFSDGALLIDLLMVLAPGKEIPDIKR